MRFPAIHTKSLSFDEQIGQVRNASWSVRERKDAFLTKTVTLMYDSELVSVEMYVPEVNTLLERSISFPYLVVAQVLQPVHAEVLYIE